MRRRCPARSAGGVAADVARSVVGEDPPDSCAVVGVGGDHGFREGDAVGATLAGAQLDHGVARVIVDGDVGVGPAGMAAAPARPSFLTARCTSSPAAACSYRFTAGRGWRSAREHWWRTNTRQIVDAGRPSAADKACGPHPVRRRSSTICLCLRRQPAGMMLGDRRPIPQPVPTLLPVAAKQPIRGRAAHPARRRSGLRTEPRKHKPHQPTSRLPRMPQSERSPTLDHHGPPSSNGL